MKKTLFKGCGTALVTPMKEDGSLNLPMLGRLIDFQLENHADALIIAGTTGESSVLSSDEHIHLIEYTVQHVKGRVPVIAGTGSNHTPKAVWLSQQAQQAGADGLLQVTPYYNKTSQTGLIRHFTTIADAVELPIILYNVPTRTSMNIAPQTYLELAKHPNITAVKEANGNISHTAQVAALCGDLLDIYSGNDDQLLPVLSLGGKGIISVISNLLPRQIHSICQLYFQGKTEESTALHLSLLPLMNAMFSDVNPIPVKTALELMGLPVGECRMPLAPLGEPQKQELTRLLEQHQLLGTYQTKEER